MLEKDQTLIYVLITVLTSILASGGFWSYLDKRRGKENTQYKLLLGLSQDRICTLSNFYIDRGWMTHEEYEDFNDNLVLPYIELGGNGMARHLSTKVDNLPIVADKRRKRLVE